MLEPAQITSRSYSDLTVIDLVLSARDADPVTRMEVISRFASEWDEATKGHPARKKAAKRARREFPYAPTRKGDL